MSIAAFVLGLLGIIPPCGLIALVLGIVALATNRAKKGFAIAGIVLGVVLMPTILMVSILLPSLARARDLARQAMCEVNLNTIGKGLVLYTAENEDKYPAALEDLLKSDYFSEKTLRSPSDTIDRDCSYFYLAPTSTNDVPLGTIVACTFKDVHNDFRHVLQINGRALRLSNAAFQAELARPYNARFAVALKKAEAP